MTGLRAGDRRRGSATTRSLAVTGVAMIVLTIIAGPAAAHPLGNLSVNTFSRVVITPDALSVDVVVDAAEIPTLQEFPQVNRLRGQVPAAERTAYRRDRCAGLGNTTSLRVDGEAVALDVTASTLTFLPGSAGLHTSRLTCTLTVRSDLATPGTRVDYTIEANKDRVGWREVVAVGSGVTLVSSDVSDESISAALTKYPADLLASPPDQTEAHVVVGTTTGGGATAQALDDGASSAQPRGLDRLTTAFTDLVSRQELTVGFAALAVLAAMALGSLHAFAPGHGKTVMAAYLIGREGSFRQAAIVGLSVTATHTLGVLALGLALTGAGLASPERVYPWLGTASGLLLAGIGLGLLVRQRARRPSTPAPGPAPTHEHHHAHDEPAVEQPHRHGLFSHTHLPPARNVKGLVAIGFAGGLVPSPSALLVLLGGIALGRAWFGVVLVLAYGLGMAGALMATGLVLVRARDTVSRYLERRSSTVSGRPVAALLARGLPVATASIVVVVGLGIAARSALQI